MLKEIFTVCDKKASAGNRTVKENRFDTYETANNFIFVIRRNSTSVDGDRKCKNLL